MTMEAKHIEKCINCGEKIEQKTSFAREWIHSSDQQKECSTLHAEPSSPEPSGEDVREQANELWRMTQTPSGKSRAEAFDRIESLLRIEAAYKRGGGK